MLSVEKNCTLVISILAEPELPKYTEETKDIAKCEEDVLSYALFPQVARTFLEGRNNPAPKVEASASSEVRTIYVQDLS